MGKMAEIDTNYAAFYKARAPRRVYPVEFVVRAFLGKYPGHALDRGSLAGGRALDLGFGDGRNMPLLADLGLEVCGVEIEQEICTQVKNLMAQSYGLSVDARVGRNVSIPFEDRAFDAVLACHACYYIDPGVTFSDNAAEIARVTKPGGLFVFSAPIGTSYIMHGAVDIGGGHMRIANDPYGVRNGYVLRKFDSEAEIQDALGAHFTDFHIGAARNDWWGIEEHVWIVACTRKA
jgi:SAM-dependent methyltransferase